MALERFLSFTMKFKMLARMKEGIVPSPHSAPALSEDGVAPVRGLSHRGSHSGGETPLVIEHVYRVKI